MAIIISQNGKNAKKIVRSSFEREDYLQKYIYDNPESIPIDDSDESTRLLILAREFPTKSGPIDAIGIDRYGTIYLIETKLYKNQDKRYVVAQVLDYGASLWSQGMDFNEFMRRIEIEVNKKFKVSLEQLLKDFFSLEDEEVPALISNIAQRLNEGEFKFVVLMDQLHDQLKDLILFINANSKFSIFAVELEYYKYEDNEIMIPKLFGAEVKKDIAVAGSSSARRRQTEEVVLEEAKQKLDSQEYAWFKRIFDFSKQNADQINYGSGSYGTFSPIFKKLSQRSLFTLGTRKRLAINFEWFDQEYEAYRDKLKEELGKIGFQFPADYKDIHPSFLIEEWGPKTEEFIGVIQKLLKQ